MRDILRAAERVFAAKGYLRATMDEIALGAEVSKATLYLYFRTKDDLFLSLMLPIYEDIQHQLEEVERSLAAGRFLSGAELIEGLLGALFHAYSASPDTFRTVQLVQQSTLLEGLSEETKRLLDERGRFDFAVARRIVVAGIKQRLLRSLPVPELVDLMWAIVVGLIQVESVKTNTEHHLVRTRLLAQQMLVQTVAAG